MRVKDGQPKIQFQTFADMINFPVKPGEQPETSTSITEVLPLELLEGYPNHEEHFPLPCKRLWIALRRSLRRIVSFSALFFGMLMADESPTYAGYIRRGG